MSEITKERIIEIANNIILTQYGSVPFLNNFGCNILKYVDQLMNVDDIDDLKINVQTQFKLWLPNYLQNIEVTQNETSLLITIYLNNIEPITINLTSLYNKNL